MPIASASSGMVMPGRAFTSSSAWMARVPEPFGRPRRPVPEPLARRRGGARRAAVGRGRRARAPCADAGERLLGGLEAVVLVDQRSQLLQALPRSPYAFPLESRAFSKPFPKIDF